MRADVLIRAIRGVVLASLLVLAATARAEARTIRIGYQKYGQLIILKQKGWLEPKLAARGDTVSWKLFTAGPQMLEALEAGAIDLGITGETPPVAAQANGAPLLYVGVEPASPAGEAIVVPKNSALRSVADLRGKRVAVTRAANAHWLLLRAVQKAGLPWSAIHPIYLAPSDGRAAFAGGDVDAWAIWDPFLADAEAETGARVLTDAAGLVPNHQFYLASKEFVRSAPDALHTVLAAAAALDAWAAGHRSEVGPLLAAAVGLPLASVQKAADRLAFGIEPLDDATIASQQQIADSFYALRLIPAPVNVRDAVWHDPKSPG